MARKQVSARSKTAAELSYYLFLSLSIKIDEHISTEDDNPSVHPVHSVHFVHKCGFQKIDKSMDCVDEVDNVDIE